MCHGHMSELTVLATINTRLCMPHLTRYTFNSLDNKHFARAFDHGVIHISRIILSYHDLGSKIHTSWWLSTE